MSGRIDTRLYNSNSLLQVGRKFRGCKLEHVPAWYFLWLLDDGISDLGLKEWVELNREILEAEKAAGVTPAMPDRANSMDIKQKIRKQFRAKPMTTREGDII